VWVRKKVRGEKINSFEEICLQCCLKYGKNENILPHCKYWLFWTLCTGRVFYRVLWQRLRINYWLLRKSCHNLELTYGVQKPAWKNALCRWEAFSHCKESD